MFKEIKKSCIQTSDGYEYYCAKCRKQVKKEDEKCPHCGFDFKEEKEER